jgi:hypothetical protein
LCSKTHRSVATSRFLVEMENVMTDDIARAFKQDREDYRCLKGKYTPEPGVCRVCSGKVVAEISFDHGHFGQRLGGPPQQGYVSGWHCEGCMIMYHARPGSKPA